MKSFNISATQTVLDDAFKISKCCLTFVKHTNNGNVGFNFCKNFGQRLESPSVRDLVRSHLGKYISNLNNNKEKSMGKAKDRKLLKLEISFYRHNTNQPISKVFNLQRTTNLK